MEAADTPEPSTTPCNYYILSPLYTTEESEQGEMGSPRVESGGFKVITDFVNNRRDLLYTFWDGDISALREREQEFPRPVGSFLEMFLHPDCPLVLVFHGKESEHWSCFHLGNLSPVVGRLRKHEHRILIRFKLHLLIRGQLPLPILSMVRRWCWGKIPIVFFQQVRAEP